MFIKTIDMLKIMCIISSKLILVQANIKKRHKKPNKAEEVYRMEENVQIEQLKTHLKDAKK